MEIWKRGSVHGNVVPHTPLAKGLTVYRVAGIDEIRNPGKFAAVPYVLDLLTDDAVHANRTFTSIDFPMDA